MVCKIVFKDSKQTKVLRGIIVSQDNFLIKIKTLDGTVFSVGKQFIISMSENGGQK